MTFTDAQRVADAVLYEGYLLYPYRASSVKNQVRWQFGVLMPRGYAEADGSERWQMQTECLVRSGMGSSLDLRVRFLRLQTRELEAVADDGSVVKTDALEVEGERFLAWEEAVEEAVEDRGGEDVVAGSSEYSVVRDAPGWGLRGELVEVPQDR